MAQAGFDRTLAYDRKKGQWRVVIETPKGSHNKYKYDEKLKRFVLSTVLPEGMVFPYDFGFLPGTKAEDGDPVDVLLLLDAPVFCGCVVLARPIGVIEAEQQEDGDWERNDRLVFVASESRTHGNCKSVKDLDSRELKEIEEFFVSYNRVKKRKFKLLGIHGPRKAEKLITRLRRK